ncbi:MAG: HD-GYP domain-containing protein [Anaerolineae bacterium]|nr:HD-GYP domain-containing protein [Anaerolineae bacterium]
MRSLPKSAQLYIAVLALATIVLLAIAFPLLLQERSDLVAIAVFALGIFLADVFPIILPYQQKAEVTVSGAFKIGAAMLLGWPITAWITMLGTFAAEIKVERLWYRAVFNISQMTLTFAAVAACYHLVSDGTPSPVHSVQNVVAFFLMGLTYYLMNTILVSFVIALTSQVSVWHIWRVNFRDISWHNLTVVPIGGILALLWESSPLAMILLVLPLAVVRESFRVSADLQRQTQEALIGLADIIDLRDPSTYRHSQRVSDLSRQIARRMRLREDRVDLIAFSARLHDLGKIGMSNILLYKPGAFSPEERDEFRRHPAIGASMVSGFHLFSEGCDLILRHHEAWDGSGYPDGLQGQAIPVGSQIIAIADAFEAMTADRVYRAAMGVPEAVAELIARRGSQFAPHIVDIFVDILREQDLIPDHNGKGLGDKDPNGGEGEQSLPPYSGSLQQHNGHSEPE